jgi:hypothetical protein
MKLNLDPVIAGPRHITAEAEALSEWYDATPAVRRLWAIRESRLLRVIVTLEPTMDNGDTLPVWFAQSAVWEREIRATTGGLVQLELVAEPDTPVFEVEADGDVVAAISWRDPAFLWSVFD